MNREHTFTLFLSPARYNGLVARVGQTSRSRRRAGEIALKLHIEVPASLFERPELQAKIVVPDATPAVIDATVAENITNIIRRETGVDVKLTVESPDA